MTTANGYRRLALFAFDSPSMSLDVDKINRLRRIVCFVASVYAPMFKRVHLKPRAVNGPGNVTFLRELLLYYQQYDEELFSAAAKKCFLSHAASWLSPTNVALSVHSDDPSFPITALQSSQQFCHCKYQRKICCGIQKPLKGFFTAESRNAPCVVLREQQFWKAIDNHNRSCERFIGKMSTVMEDKKVREERSLSVADFDKKYEDMSSMIIDYYYLLYSEL